MSQTKFQIIVSGQLVAGFDIDTVKNNVAKLFKTDVSKVESMFSGQPIAIKKGLDENTTRQYMLALKKAGLVSKGRPMPSEQSTAQATATPKKAPPPPPLKPTSGTEPEPAENFVADIAAVGAELDQRPPPPAANINTDGLIMAEAGEQIIEAQTIDAPDIDTSHFETAEVGAELDSSAPAPVPDFDTAHLIVDEVGTVIDNTPPAPEFQADLSQLSVAQAGETIMEHPKVPAADIDTSKLKFSDD